MPILMPKKLPRYECLLEAAKRFPDLDPSACEAFLHLMRAGDEAIHGCENYFARHNLSQGRFGVLMQLIDKGEGFQNPRTPAELAEMTGVTRATMTGLIDTLERDGLVKREPDPVDRRMLSVRLTAKGEALLREILPGHFKRMASLMEPLSETERKTLVRLLNKVLEKLKSPDHESTTSCPILK
jgi:DNA-binding MarR family transcriptional regulator